jgi:hypothetical protein
MKLRFAVTLCFFSALTCAQVKVSGTIDGKPIPDSVFNPAQRKLYEQFIIAHGRLPGNADQQEIQSTIVPKLQCVKLKQLIRIAAFDRLKQQFHVIVTQKDLEEIRNSTPLVRRNQTFQSAILDAISAVYDKHEDPDAVYHKELAAWPIGKNYWMAYLYDASTPEGRQEFEEPYRHALRSFRLVSEAPPPLEGFRNAAEAMKLLQFMDQQLASTDPTFQSYLQECNKTKKQEGSLITCSQGRDHFEYLAKKHNEYWKNAEAKVNVYLSDPRLGKTCGLPQYLK